MKKFYQILIICFISITGFAQVTVNQGFENSGSLPTGWTATIGSGSYNWIVGTSGTSPTCSPHGGSYMMRYQSFSQTSGGYALLISPVVDWSRRSGVATTVTAWLYRDCAAYNTSSYNLEGVTAYVNTTNSLSGSPVSMGFVPRAGSQAISGGVTGTSTTSTSGWYQYTFTVPATFNSSTNFLIFKAYSQYGDNQGMDDVSYTTYPCLNSTIGGYSVPVCSGTSLTLTDATIGGAWSSSNTSVATIGSATGIMTAAAAGTAVITNTASCGAVVTTTVTVLAAPSAATGNVPVCQGGTIILSNSSGTGTWSSGAAGTATVGSASGIVTGIIAGTVSINYTLSSTGCTSSSAVTVNALPSAISGGLTVCAGTSTVLSSATTGGTWSSSNTLLAAVGSSSGNVTTIASGNPIINYTLPTGCSVNTVMTVNTQPGAIAGVPVFCGTQTTTLTSSPTGGTWASSNTGVAVTAGSVSGIITGTSTGGNATITYTLSNGCLSIIPVTVNPLANITGVTGLCIGATTTLNNVTVGGIWSSSNPTVATVVSGTGILSGVSLGAATISFIISSTGCTATANETITGSPSAFAVTGGGSFCPGGAGVHVGLAGSAVGFNYMLSLGGVTTGASIPGTGSPLDFGLVSAPGSYTVVANPGTTCATNMTGIAPLANYPLPTPFTITGGGSFCAGGAGVHIYLAGSNTGYMYQLYKNATAVGSPLSGTSGVLDFGMRSDSGIYTVFATNTVTTCTNAMSGSPLITINPLPNLYPVIGGGGYCAGGTGIPVSLANSTSGINYQLYKGGISTGAPLGGTGLPLSFGNQTIAGNYTVIATNPATGCTCNMSGSSSVTVNPLPSVFPVTGGGAYCSGGSGVHIGLGGSAVGVNYQMQTGGVATGSSISGTGSALDFGFVSTGGVYSVIATNATTTCTNTMTGSPAVSVNPAPTSFNVTGGGSYCAGGTGVHVTLSGSQSGVSYSLYNGTALAGGGSGTGALLDFGLKTAAGSYTVIGTKTTTGCTGNMSGSTAISIATINTYTVTGSAAYCAGSTAPHVLLSGSDAGINYQLFKGTAPVGTTIPGTSSSIDFGAQSAAATYTVKASGSGSGCNATMSGSAVISVNPAPSVYSVTGGGSYCAGGSGVHVRLAGSVTGISYNLYNAGILVDSAVAGTGSILDFGLQTTGGTYNVTATNATTTCSVNMSGSAAITVNALPNAYTVTGGGTYCSGGTGKHIGLSNSNPGIIYQLYNSTALAGPSVDGSGSVIDFGLKTASGIYTAIARNPVTSCSVAMTGSASISVPSLPVSYSVTGGGTICAGATGAHIGLSNSATGINYQLFNGIIPSGTLLVGSGSALDFGLISAAGTYSVMATNPATTCSKNMSGSAIIAPGTLPVSHDVTGGGTYCTGGAGLNIGLDGSNAGTNYQLYMGGIPMSSLLPGSGTALSFGLQTTAGNYTVLATNGVSGCSTSMPGGATITISTHPTNYYVTGGGGYCPGGAGVHIGLSSSDIGIDYTLFNGTSTGVIVSGTGSALDFGIHAVPGNYTVMAISTTSTCSGNMIGSANVFVASLPSVYSITGGGAYCNGSGSGVPVGLNGSNIGVSYQLYNSGIATGTIVPGTGSAIDFGLHIAGNYTVVATSGAACNNNMDGVAHITANPLPGAHNVTGGGTFCSGGSGVHIQLDGSSADAYYQLMLGGTPTGASIDGTGFPVDFGVQSSAGNYTVKATKYTTTCTSVMSGSANIAVSPLPSAYTVSGGGAYCAYGAGAHIYLSSSTSGIAYMLYDGTTLVGPPVYGTGSSLDFGLQTPVGSYTIVANNSATGCRNTMIGTASITTNPLPAKYNLSGGGGYCTGGTGVSFYLSKSDEGVSYRLFNGTTPTGMAYPGIGSSINFGLRTNAGNYAAIATDNLTGCSDTMNGIIPVSVNALPAVYPVTGSGSAYCQGGSGIEIHLNNSTAGINYQLMRGMASVTGNVPGINGLLSFGNQTVPAVYTVKAIDPATGCSRIMSGSAAVAINQLPAVYNVTGGGGYCPGTSGTPVGLGNSESGISYQLFHNGVAIGSGVYSTGPAINYGLQSLPGNYTVIATNTSTSCTRMMNNMAVVSVNPLPASFTVTGGGSFCAGGTGVTVGLNGSVSGTAYQLMNGSEVIGAPINAAGGLISFGLQNLPGNYTIMATNSSTGCSGSMSGSATVSVLPLPQAFALTGGGNYCEGGAGQHVGISGSNSGINYSLYNGSSMVAGPAPGLGFGLDFGVLTAQGTYTVVAKNASTSCVSYMPGNVSIQVNPLPNEFAVTGGGNYCAGASGVPIGLSASTSGISYTLFNGAAQAGTYSGSGMALDFGLRTAAGNYTVQATDLSTACTINMPGSADVAITPLVVPSVSILSALGDTACAGLAATYTAISVNGGPAPVFQWIVNGITTGNDSSYTYLPADGDVIGMTMTSNATCALASVSMAEATVTVLANKAPVVNISANPGLEVCQGTSVSLTATPLYGGDSPSFKWLKNGTILGAGSILSYVPSSGDVVTCELSSNYQCRITNSGTSLPATIIVDSPAIPLISITAYPSAAIAAGESATVVASVVHGGSAPSYQWYVNGVIVPGAVNPSFTSRDFANADVVSCTVLCSNACGQESASEAMTLSVSNVSVAQLISSVADITIVPNPNKGIFVLKGNIVSSDAEFTIELTNMLGQVIYRNKVFAPNGIINEKVQLNNDIVNGMYLLNIRSGSESKLFHVVVEK